MMILETLLQGGLYSFLWTTVWFLIVLTVLCFNFVGDGLRDAADPYAEK